MIFELKNTNLAFFQMTIFDNLITKMMPNFWQLATTPTLKIQ